ncbi:MAG: hypothetical protein ACTHJ4_06110 [Candidatus Nucleicultricaceae bacterium]
MPYRYAVLFLLSIVFNSSYLEAAHENKLHDAEIQADAPKSELRRSPSFSAQSDASESTGLVFAYASQYDSEFSRVLTQEGHALKVQKIRDMPLGTPDLPNFSKASSGAPLLFDHQVEDADDYGGLRFSRTLEPLPQWMPSEIWETIISFLNVVDNLRLQTISPAWALISRSHPVLIPHLLRLSPNSPEDYHLTPYEFVVFMNRPSFRMIATYETLKRDALRAHELGYQNNLVMRQGRLLTDVILPPEVTSPGHVKLYKGRQESQVCSLLLSGENGALMRAYAREEREDGSYEFLRTFSYETGVIEYNESDDYGRPVVILKRTFEDVDHDSTIFKRVAKEDDVDIQHMNWFQSDVVSHDLSTLAGRAMVYPTRQGHLNKFFTERAAFKRADAPVTVESLKDGNEDMGWTTLNHDGTEFYGMRRYAQLGKPKIFKRGSEKQTLDILQGAPIFSKVTCASESGAILYGEGGEGNELLAYREDAGIGRLKEILKAFGVLSPHQKILSVVKCNENGRVIIGEGENTQTKERFIYRAVVPLDSLDALIKENVMVPIQTYGNLMSSLGIVMHENEGEV